jgi:hypothetical protein
LKHLQELEIALHQYEIRTDLKRLAKLLHPEYIEIGYSGRTFDFNSIIESVSSEPKPNFEIWSQSYQFIELDSNIVQLIYKSARLGNHGNLSRHAKRTSIWVKESDWWQVKFHQATPVGTFEMAKAHTQSE